MEHHRREYRHKSFKIIRKSCRYTDVDYINGDKAATATFTFDEPIYVIPVFLPPGKHSFLFSLKDNLNITNTLQSVIIDSR